MAVPLGSDSNSSSQIVSGGFNWLPFNVFFASADCSGTPYLFPYTYGTRYEGFPVIDGGQVYIFVIDSTQGGAIEYNSIYNSQSATCFVTNGTDWRVAGQATIAATPLGTPPFWIR